MRHIGNLLRWLNVFVIIGTLFAYISPWVNPSPIWFFSFFGTAYSWFLLANILFVFFWIFAKKWHFVLSLLTILLGWNYLTSFVGLHFSSPPTSPTAVRVMSYNIEGLRKLVNRHDKVAQQDKRDRFFGWLNHSIEPDILCTQETGWQDLITQNTALVHYTRNQGVAVFSKYPIEDKGKINFSDIRGNACVWMDIRLPNKQIIRVYSIHLQSNGITSDTDRLIENPDLQEKETWQGVRSILGKYKRAAANRVKQARLIAQHANSSPHPVILCGDFNETPLSYAYQILVQNRQDTFQEGAFGIGTTFSGNIPGLKIDYILADPDFRTLKHQILKSQEAFSDHYPIVSTVELKK